MNTSPLSSTAPGLGLPRLRTGPLETTAVVVVVVVEAAGTEAAGAGACADGAKGCVTGAPEPRQVDVVVSDRAAGAAFELEVGVGVGGGPMKTGTETLVSWPSTDE